jgi:hypothetical protein
LGVCHGEVAAAAADVSEPPGGTLALEGCAVPDDDDVPDGDE